jgi:hypothetical protein
LSFDSRLAGLLRLSSKQKTKYDGDETVLEVINTKNYFQILCVVHKTSQKSLAKSWKAIVTVAFYDFTPKN